MSNPKRFELGHEEFRFMRMFLQARKIYFIAGANSLFVPSRQEKYLMATRPDGSRVTRVWQDEKGDSYAMTPGEIARVELKKTFPGLRKVGWMAGHINLFDWRWPMLYTGPQKGEGSYIDLKGAYHQIYSRLWLDTAFPCGYGSLSLTSIADTLRNIKSARNSVVGVTAGRIGTGVLGYKTIQLKTRNPYLAPGLWATIQAILNELAFRAERLRAIYIATDGYIFPERSSADVFEEFLYDNGFTYRRKDGPYEIKAWGAYQVPEKETSTFSPIRNYRHGNFRSITLADNEYPTKLSRWWSKSVPRYKRARWQETVREQWLTI